MDLPYENSFVTVALQKLRSYPNPNDDDLCFGLLNLDGSVNEGLLVAATSEPSMYMLTMIFPLLALLITIQ